MKIEELMIGDWYWWEAEGKKYPMQVSRYTFTLTDDDIATSEITYVHQLQHLLRDSRLYYNYYSYYFD